MITVENLFDEGEVQTFDDLWNGIAQRRAAANLPPAATLMKAHTTIDEVIGIVKHQRLVGCIETLLGGEVELIGSQLMFNPPGSVGFSPHQDDFYTRADRPDDVITVWIAVDRVDVENGALYGFPGSHMQGMVPTKRDYKYLLSKAPEIAKLLFRTLWDNGQKRDQDVGAMERFIHSEIPTAIEKVPMEVSPGSVCFIHGHLVHGSFPNVSSQRTRCSLVCNYIRSDTKFDAGKLSGRQAFNLYDH